jgi:tRNA (pseudouridine54-N1)-methyltransferase
MVRRFVVVGQTAASSADFSLDDLPGSSGRLDVLIRCLRAALLVSHGLRRDTVIYLVLLGGPRAPRSLRFDGATAKYVRPDERSLAVLVKKSLAAPAGGSSFVPVRPGVAVAEGGFDAVLADAAPVTPYLLDERAADVREAAFEEPDAVYFLGDHVGLDDATRARLGALGARAISVGPVSVHADDAITILHNELDRRAARP